MTGKTVVIVFEYPDGRFVTSTHRVWDVDRFFAAKIREGGKDNAVVSLRERI